MSLKEKCELFFAPHIHTKLSQFWKKDFNVELFKIDVRHCFEDYMDKDIIITRSTPHFIEVHSMDGKQYKIYEKGDYAQ